MKVPVSGICLNMIVCNEADIITRCLEEVNDGTIILTFTDCENGTVEYDIPSIDQQGIIPIVRVVGDNIALCEALNTD